MDLAITIGQGLGFGVACGLSTIALLVPLFWPGIDGRALGALGAPSLVLAAVDLWLPQIVRTLIRVAAGASTVQRVPLRLRRRSIHSTATPHAMTIATATRASTAIPTGSQCVGQPSGAIVTVQYPSKTSRAIIGQPYWQCRAMWPSDDVDS